VVSFESENPTENGAFFYVGPEHRTGGVEVNKKRAVCAVVLILIAGHVSSDSDSLKIWSQMSEKEQYLFCIGVQLGLKVHTEHLKSLPEAFKISRETRRGAELMTEAATLLVYPEDEMMSFEELRLRISLFYSNPNNKDSELNTAILWSLLTNLTE
jgi:hypothetical protein